jgi:hypothetical protein
MPEYLILLVIAGAGLMMSAICYTAAYLYGRHEQRDAGDEQ